jgi:phosphoribosylanthranilate isomerase
MTWIKICGITNLEDALTAVKAGADALGFVFYEKSPRRIDPERVREIIAALPGAIEKVGVFVEESAEQVRETAERTGLTAVQLSRMETLVGCMRKTTAPHQLKKILSISAEHLADGEFFTAGDFARTLFALMIDSGTPAQPGGTGRRFDWVSARTTMEWLNDICPTIVAGGLSPANVAEALTMFAPWGVDVSSGVEAAPGKKDPDKVRAFVQAVRAAEKSA